MTMALKAPFYRLRHDLGRELVVAVSSLIFIGTFLYVFEDFLNVQVASLSTNLRWWMAAILQGALALGVALSTGFSLSHQRQAPRGIEATARFLAEDPKTLVAFRRVWAVLQGSTSFGLVGLISSMWLVPLDLRGNILMFVAMGLLAWLSYALALRRPGRPSPLALRRPVRPSPVMDASPVVAMTQFRILQLFHGKPQLRWGIRLSQGAVALAAPASLALTRLGFLAGFGGLLAGLILAAWFVVFIAEDLTQTWTEKGTGMHHNDYIKTLEILSWRLIRWPLVVSLLLTSLVISQRLSLSSSSTEILALFSSMLPAALTGALGVLLVPWVVMQIDGTKPAIPLMTVTIMGLFIGSAMLAHPLGILLVPLIRSFALNYQQGRFYRS